MSKRRLAEWENYAKRTGRTLDGYLQRIKNIEEALKHFTKQGLNPPSIEAIEKALQANAQVAQTTCDETVQSDEVKMQNSSENTANPSPKKKGKKKQSEPRILLEESDSCERIGNEEIQENPNSEELSTSSEETAAVEEIFPENAPQ
jgi:hypothetical protein